MFSIAKKTVLEKLTSTYDVKLDASASQLIMDVLAKLYDNPVEAAIREYVSNAYDANVEAGSTEPVHLHVPTEDEPYLEVSDTGNGLDYYVRINTHLTIINVLKIVVLTRTKSIRSNTKRINHLVHAT